MGISGWTILMSRIKAGVGALQGGLAALLSLSHQEAGEGALQGRGGPADACLMIVGTMNKILMRRIKAGVGALQGGLAALLSLSHQEAGEGALQGRGPSLQTLAS